MKKIAKLLPVALALMIAVPAFAETVASKTSDKTTLQINVPKFIYINHTSKADAESATASFDADYTILTLDKGMAATFSIVTNNPDEKVQLTATAKAGSTNVNALFGTATAPNIVFTNTGAGKRQATADAVTNIITSPAKTANANAFALAVQPATKAVADSGGVDPTPTKNGNAIEYPLVNGAYTFTYTFAQTALENTFSTHDADGQYQATITLSQVSS